MKMAFIKKQLVNGIDNINIPQKEQLLPVAAFEKSTNRKPQIYYKKIATAVAALVVIVSVILGVNSINFNGVTPTPQPPVVDTRPVIYATGTDKIPSIDVDASEYEWANGISELLKQKMEEYKGQDVLFSVYVRFPKIYEYNDGFVRSDELSRKFDEINTKIEPIKNKILQLQKIYPYRSFDTSIIPILKEMTEEEKQRLYPHLDDLTEEEIKSIKKQIDDLWDELDPLIEERFDYFHEEYIEENEHFNKNWQKEIESVKQIVGSDNFNKKFSGHSEIAKYSLTNTYIMELTADTINKIAERGTTDIYLALPERTGDYSKKISDTLTYYLEQMDEDDTIEIAAVSMLDKASEYALDQNLTRNEFYNGENFKSWPFKSPTESFTYTEFNKIIDNYINEIMVRNNIADKRIIHDKLPWLGIEKLPWYEDDVLVMTPSESGHYITAGFNARLTKAEILSLVDEEEIKTLYFVGDIDSSLPGAEHND